LKIDTDTFFSEIRKKTIIVVARLIALTNTIVDSCLQKACCVQSTLNAEVSSDEISDDSSDSSSQINLNSPKRARSLAHGNKRGCNKRDGCNFDIESHDLKAAEAILALSRARSCQKLKRKIVS